MSNVIDISTPILQGVEQAAKTLGVSKHFIYTGVKSGKIPCQIRRKTANQYPAHRAAHQRRK